MYNVFVILYLILLNISTNWSVEEKMAPLSPFSKFEFTQGEFYSVWKGTWKDFELNDYLPISTTIANFLASSATYRSTRNLQNWICHCHATTCTYASIVQLATSRSYWLMFRIINVIFLRRWKVFIYTDDYWESILKTFTLVLRLKFSLHWNAILRATRKRFQQVEIEKCI